MEGVYCYGLRKWTKFSNDTSLVAADTHFHEHFFHPLPNCTHSVTYGNTTAKKKKAERAGSPTSLSFPHGRPAWVPLQMPSSVYSSLLFKLTKKFKIERSKDPQATDPPPPHPVPIRKPGGLPHGGVWSSTTSQQSGWASVKAPTPPPDKPGLLNPARNKHDPAGWEKVFQILLRSLKCPY